MVAPYKKALDNLPGMALEPALVPEQQGMASEAAWVPEQQDTALVRE